MGNLCAKREDSSHEIDIRQDHSAQNQVSDETLKVSCKSAYQQMRRYEDKQFFQIWTEEAYSTNRIDADEHAVYRQFLEAMSVRPDQ